MEMFTNDKSASAYEKLVDQLLGSRQFGVHWGRHWLDVARYADSNGGDFNATFHNAFHNQKVHLFSSIQDDTMQQLVM